MLQLQMDEEEYRIVDPDGGDEGALVDYGEIATLVTEHNAYVALVTDPNEQDELKVYALDVAELTEVPAEVLDVEVEVEAGDDEPEPGEAGPE